MKTFETINYNSDFTVNRILRDALSTIQLHLCKYIVLVLGATILVLGLSAVFIALKLSPIFTRTISLFVLFVIYTAFFRLSVYGRYESMLGVLPAINLRVVRFISWNILVFLIVLAVTSVPLSVFIVSQNTTYVPALVGYLSALLGCIIGGYLLCRMILTPVAVICDVTSPLVLSWKSTKNNVLRIFCVLLIIYILFCLDDYFINDILSFNRAAEFTSKIDLIIDFYFKGAIAIFSNVIIIMLSSSFIASAGVKLLKMPH